MKLDFGNNVNKNLKVAEPNMGIGSVTTDKQDNQDNQDEQSNQGKQRTLVDSMSEIDMWTSDASIIGDYFYGAVDVDTLYKNNPKFEGSILSQA